MCCFSCKITLILSLESFPILYHTLTEFEDNFGKIRQTVLFAELMFILSKFAVKG